MNDELAVRERDIFAPIEAATMLPPGSLTMVGLDLRDVTMEFGDWQELGRRLAHVHRWTSWALGDWLNFGEALFGMDAFNATEGSITDRYDLATRVTGLAPGTLQNIASVCGRIARERRRVELYFSTHEPVASLEPAAQTEWLQRAVDDGLSRNDLREAIREAKRSTPTADAGAPAQPRRSLFERRDDAARLVLRQAQRMPGGMLIPDEAWAQLVEAYGGE